jgi:predicted TIM-barrel fold metal-dependent hydrolase
MVVDIHVHVSLARYDNDSCKRVTDKLLDCMERTGIDKVNLMPMMVSSGPGYFYTKKDMTFCAEYLARIQNEYPDRFLSMLWTNPNIEISFLKGLIREYIINGPINGVKLHADMNAADRRLEPLAGFLEEHNIPVLYHCFDNVLGKYVKESDPSDIACLARKFPALRITMAHLGGDRHRGVQYIKKHPNVSVDTAGSYQEDGYLEYALNELGPDRILYGSDYPGRDFATSLARIDSLELPTAVKEKLFAGNALRFLRGWKS